MSILEGLEGGPESERNIIMYGRFTAPYVFTSPPAEPDRL